MHITPTTPHRPMKPATYARLIGVSSSTVSRWIKSGRVSVNEFGYLDPDTANREREATESPLPHHQARKAQIDAQRGQSPAQNSNAAPEAPMEVQGMSNEAVGTALRYETYRLQKAKAEKAAMEADQLAGSLIEMTAATEAFAGIGHLLRSLAETIPERHAAELASHQGDIGAIRKDLETIVHALLSEFALEIQRQSAALGA